MIYIYNAGPLFTEADINQRHLEGEKFNKVLKENNQEYFLANPIDLPFDNSRILTSKEIFEGDYKHVNKANVFFFELASNDAGTYVELGNAIEKLMSGKKNQSLSCIQRPKTTKKWCQRNRMPNRLQFIPCWVPYSQQHHHLLKF